MTKNSIEFPVKVYRSNYDEEIGILRYTCSGPIIRFESGEEIKESNDVYFALHDFIDPRLPILQNEIVQLKPRIEVVMGYAPKGTVIDRMYPQSSDKWITHVIDGQNLALYAVQDIRNSQHKLLTIISLDDPGDFISYKIHTYETTILEMKHDLIVQNAIRESFRKEFDLYSILDAGPPLWSIIDRLVEGVNIADLSLKQTMGETLKQLVPSSFPERARKQIIAFLAWTETAEIPSEDPMDFIQRYAEFDIFNSLVTGHIKCLLDDRKPPPYVKIMNQADTGSLKVTERPTLAAVEQNPWYLTQLKLYEMFPDWMKRALELTEILNEKGKIIGELPVTKKEALRSKKSWGDRFALITQGLAMRGYVRRESIGLRTLVYVGAAHKWPHFHLEFSARLGYRTEKSPQIQLMAFPESSIEQVTRVLPSVHIIDWETNSANLSLYNNRKGRWRINSSILLKSLEHSRSLQQLKTEFGSRYTTKTIQLSPVQAKVLDMISWGIYLVNLEDNRYSRYYKIDNMTIKDTLESLQKQGIFKLFYLTTMQKLTSICVSAHGPSNHICSLARSFLKHAPTSDVRIAGKGSWCFIISRVPEDDAFDLLNSLQSQAKECEINLTARPISAYIGYRNNLYQRLLQNDGSWNNDVSGILTQVSLH